MKRKVLLIPFVAVMALLFVAMVSAIDNDNIVYDDIDTEFNGVILVAGSSHSMVGDVGSVVPVRVTFTAEDNVSDVRVEVSVDGFREDVSAETSRFDIVQDKQYTKLLSLELPDDADELNDEYTLKVEITHDGSNAYEEYTISMQRESYTFDIKSVDFDSQVEAGDVVPVAVVVNNNGFNRMDDVYVVVSIPSLGVSSSSYLGDLVSTEVCGDDCEDEEDSLYRTVYLTIPSGTDSGVYELKVEAYNDDAEVSTKELISIESLTSTMVLASVKSQDLNAGETVEYDLIIVNSGDDVGVYTLSSISGNDFSVSVPSVVTVAPDSSTTVSVEVTADDDADVGTYTFSVDVDGEVTTFGANVIGGSVSASVVALTVVLVIVFVVLLAVLVVLLTKKEKPIEEVETSYY